MVIRRLLGPAAVAIAMLATPARSACSDRSTPVAVTAPITPRDLLELTDIGYPDGSISDAPAPVAVDPSGERIAFVEARADIATNVYCYRLIVDDLRGGAPRVVARGGEYAPQSSAVRGLFANFGTPLVAAPIWSPDGRWLAWRRRDAGVTQVWIASADGTSARRVTAAASDVEAVAWAGSRRLLYATRPGAVAARGAADREGRTGWVYDRRFTPNAGPRPLLEVASAPLRWFSTAVDGGRSTESPPPIDPRYISASGSRLSVARAGSLPTAPLALTWRSASGETRSCPAERCSGGLTNAWWQPGTDIAWFLRREGWRKEVSALYRWRADGDPERMVATSDLLNWCVPSARALICLRETSRVPRQIVAIAWTDGAVRTLYDPNPNFSRFRLGSVTRLKWRNDRGLEAWGDLVLPPHYRPGEKVPMIVVQYHSRGFLRGGTGNEYPIFPFAERGIAVLSLERPDAIASLYPQLTSVKDILRVMARDWGDRKSVHSSLEQGVRAAIATGAIDPARIGVTGLSDGATAARYALINSRLFAAAAISSCCVEPETSALAGMAWSDEFLDWGAPALAAPDAAFWQSVSLERNADRIDTPLLMQLSDDEYLLALGAFEALRVRNKPVEMIVYPDEHHNKYQPRHLAATYERNLDWFDFWLSGHEDPDPSKRAQYARWEALRQRR